MSNVKVIFQFMYQGKLYAFNTEGRFEYGTFHNTVHIKLPEERAAKLLDSLVARSLEASYPVLLERYNKATEHFKKFPDGCDSYEDGHHQGTLDTLNILFNYMNRRLE